MPLGVSIIGCLLYLAISYYMRQRKGYCIFLCLAMFLSFISSCLVSFFFGGDEHIGTAQLLFLLIIIDAVKELRNHGFTK